MGKRKSNGRVKSKETVVKQQNEKQDSKNKQGRNTLNAKSPAVKKGRTTRENPQGSLKCL